MRPLPFPTYHGQGDVGRGDDFPERDGSPLRILLQL